MADPLLPQEFAELEPLAQAGWCLTTERERTKKRRTSTTEELRTFYATVRPRLEAVLDYLDQFAVDNMPTKEQNLLNLTLSMTEVAFAVEKYKGNPSGFQAIEASRFVPVHDVPSGAASKPTLYKGED